MTKSGVFLLIALFVFSIISTACASIGILQDVEISGLTSTAAPEDVPEAFDGVILPSAEAYLEGMPACDIFYANEKYYTYRYNNCGEVYDDEGNAAVWALFEQYVQDIVSTGHFEVAHHDDEGSISNLWCLTYTGPGELTHPFSTKRNLPEIYAITIESLLGDVYVHYSIDITTTDLQQTMERLGYAPPSGDGDCNACNGDGKCDKCGGSGYIYKTVLQDGKHETIHTSCDGPFCSFGSCFSCGGDGDL